MFIKDLKVIQLNLRNLKNTFLPVVLLGVGLLSLLLELLEPEESESLELDPELSEDDFDDFLFRLTCANAAARANCLPLRPSESTFEGAGGFCAPALIIPENKNHNKCASRITNTSIDSKHINGK